MNFSFQLLFRACFDFLGLKTGAGVRGEGGGDQEDQDFLGYHPCWEN